MAYRKVIDLVIKCVEKLLRTLCVSLSHEEMNKLNVSEKEKKIKCIQNHGLTLTGNNSNEIISTTSVLILLP